MPKEIPLVTYSEYIQQHCRSIRAALLFTFVLITLIILIAIDATDYQFLLVGASYGAVFSSLVIINHYKSLRDGNCAPPLALLFWRSVCDLGLSARFLAINGFNWYLCQSAFCNDEQLCALPSAVLQFFAVSSEMWFFCIGADLVYSITNPFSSFEHRIKFYHIFVWTTAVLYSTIPLFNQQVTQAVYGFFYINAKQNDLVICWVKVHSKSANFYIIWLMYFIMIMVVYVFCVACLYVAYKRLKRGITLTFLPRMRLLTTNTANVFCLLLYWFLAAIFYGWSFETANGTFGTHINNILLFIIAIKGFSAYFVLVFIDHGISKGTDKSTIDSNKALREEVLHFATSGIRNTCSYAIHVSKYKDLTLKPRKLSAKQGDYGEKLITPAFFFKFILGYSAQLSAIETMAAGKHRSVDDGFRHTISVSRLSQIVDMSPSIGGTQIKRPSNASVQRLDINEDDVVGNTRRSVEMNSTVNRSENHENAKQDDEENRLFQRSTVIGGSVSLISNPIQRPQQPTKVATHQKSLQISTADFNNSEFSSISKENMDSKKIHTESSSSEMKNSLFSYFGSFTPKRRSDISMDGGGRVETSVDESSRKYQSDSQRATMLEMEVLDRDHPGHDIIDIDNKYNPVRKFFRSLFSFFSLDSNETVEFTEFQPYHFRRIRQSVGVTDVIYRRYFSATMKERLTSGGASGAFFFFSKDERFIAKSCTSKEVETIRKNAEKYADYLVQNPNSLISKIYGVYQLKIYGNALNFFVMGNIFLNKEGLLMNEKYDIKGSWVARNASLPTNGQTATCRHCNQKFTFTKKKKANKGSSKFGSRVRSKSQLHDPSVSVHLSAASDLERQRILEDLHRCALTVDGQHEPNVILKDNDLKFKLRLPPDLSQTLIQQLSDDANFICSLGIMDYSLLVGVHNKAHEVNPTSPASSRASRMSNAPPMIESKPETNSSLEDIGVHPSLQSPAIIRRPEPLLSDEKISPMHASVIPFVQHGGPSTSSDDLQAMAGAKSEVRDEGEESGGFSMTSNFSQVTTPSYTTGANKDGNSLTSQINYEDATYNKKLEVMTVVGPHAYFMGIIDYQQEWNLEKQMERLVKIHVKGSDPDGLSAIPPVTYRERFLRKLEDLLDCEIMPRNISLRDMEI